MPLGRAPTSSGTGTYVTPPGTVVGPEPLLVGMAVGISTVGIVPCSANDLGYNFLGFALSDSTTGNPVGIMTMRGSSVRPIVEGDVPLVPAEKVFLSATPGKVTQTPPVGTGWFSIQVGVASSPTELIILTDTRIKLL